MNCRSINCRSIDCRVMAHLNPNMAVTQLYGTMHFGFLLSATLQFTRISEPASGSKPTGQNDVTCCCTIQIHTFVKISGGGNCPIAPLWLRPWPALYRNDVHHGKDALLPLSLLNNALQRRDALHHSPRSSPLLTPASHRCAPPLPPITGRPDEIAVRLAPEASHTVPYG